jgi:digeranylgeranylglycerophospholipid reductase
VAKKYDVIVVGAGPAGLVAAKAAGENGFEVALLERKTNLTVMDRACVTSLDSANEYLHHDLFRCNVRDKRLGFPAHGFSVKYDGPYRNAYGWYFYSPSGNRMQAGVVEEQKKKGDDGKITTVIDKEILFRCLLEEVKAYSVDVFPGINVVKVTTTADGVTVEGSGQSFEGRYLIAADGANSRIAQMLGMNEGRAYFSQLRIIMYHMSGVEPPEPDAVASSFCFIESGPTMWLLFPKSPEGEYNYNIATMDSRVDLEEADNHVLKESFFAPWFKNAKILRTFSANENCYTPIVEPFKGRVVIAGDVGATQELEVTGAMICGWKVGHAVSTALQEENLGLEVTAIAQYGKWWQEDYVNSYSYDTYMKIFALPILLGSEETDYLFSMIKEPLPPCFNPYTLQDYIGHALGKVMPTIERERPDVFRRLQRMSLPATELYADITRTSKPIL